MGKAEKHLAEMAALNEEFVRKSAERHKEAMRGMRALLASPLADKATAPPAAAE
jgi:hypothetical protein